jgi:FKBP-type peptidyl-prolyl cis-trans isomerase SlyD
MMQISQDCVVALTWVLTDTLGEQLDVLDEPLEFFLGGGDLLPAIEEVLQGHRAGDALQMQMEPDQAFGDFDDKLLFLEPRELFPPELEVGLLIEGSALPTGCNPAAPRHTLFTVTDIYPEHVVLDANHPLAGIAIRLRMRVESVREASQEELQRGSTGSGFFRIEAIADPGYEQRTLH